MSSMGEHDPVNRHQINCNAIRMAYRSIDDIRICIVFARTSVGTINPTNLPDGLRLDTCSNVIQELRNVYACMGVYL